MISADQRLPSARLMAKKVDLAHCSTVAKIACSLTSLESQFDMRMNQDDRWTKAQRKRGFSSNSMPSKQSSERESKKRSDFQHDTLNHKQGTKK